MAAIIYSVAVWLGVVTGLPAASAAEGVHANSQTVFVTEDGYEVIRDNLEQAIIGRGLVVSSISHVGDMLARTDLDLGTNQQIYAHAEVLEFCSYALSRRMMEADPANIVFCPYGIAIFERADQPGKVYLGHRRLQGLGSGVVNETMKEIDALLDDIIQEAMD
jgi:uncharacterized protein (DUF302 family)